MGRLISTKITNKNPSDIIDLEKLNKDRFNTDIKESEEIKVPKKKEVLKKSKLRTKVKGFKMYPTVIQDFEKTVMRKKIELQDKGLDDKIIDNTEYIMYLIKVAEKLKLMDIYMPVDEFTGELMLGKKMLEEHLKKVLK